MSDEKDGKKGYLWHNVVFTKYGAPQFPEGFHEETLEEWESNATPATLVRLKFSAGRTINLGDYASVRFDMEIELPGHVTEIPDMCEAAEAIIAPRFQRMVNKLKQNKGSFNSGKGRREFLTETYGSSEDDEDMPY